MDRRTTSLVSLENMHKEQKSQNQVMQKSHDQVMRKAYFYDKQIRLNNLFHQQTKMEMENIKGNIVDNVIIQ